MAAVMTPVNNNVGRKSLGPARGGNIPLFTSPRTRKSTGQPGLRLTPSGNRESLADSDQQASVLVTFQFSNRSVDIISQLCNSRTMTRKSSVRGRGRGLPSSSSRTWPRLPRLRIGGSPWAPPLGWPMQPLSSTTQTASNSLLKMFAFYNFKNGF